MIIYLFIYLFIFVTVDSGVFGFVTVNIGVVDLNDFFCLYEAVEVYRLLL